VTAAALAPLQAAARAFRLGMEAQGQEAFVAFVDALQAELALPRGAAVAPRLQPLLPELLAAQERGDFLRVADLLEHELRPLLEAP
jgi:hypothetical protein